VKFTKMHGLGNDFVMVDGFQEHLAEATLPDLARRVCDRHFGVGGDGLILALPSDKADFRMRLINSDGSEAEHCGNGIRCVAKLVFDRGHTLSREITIETTGRINVLQLFAEGGKVETVRVDMAEPIFERARIPMIGPADGECIDEPLDVEGRELRFTAVSMGNPHVVTFVDDPDAFPVTQLGPLVENHASFPRRTNVEFIQVLGPGELKMRVWERGAGETLACGTGACASLVAAHRTGRTGRKAVVHLRGGGLRIEWSDDNHIYMTGPAVTVFEGEYPAA
jgi:diaminopimelate epimerase